MIKPTVGRVIWWFEHDNVTDLIVGPMVALIADVYPSGRVTLVGWDLDGKPRIGLKHVRIVENGDATDEDVWAQWMPYQQGQAAKTEQLEAKLQEAQIQAEK